jgi:hypothetical protein
MNVNGYEYVDLGLPSGTLWASKNVGAEEITQIGNYFQHGETTIKNGFYKDSYKFFNKKSLDYIKYNEKDGLLELEEKDDAAHINMGNNWYMPTEEQCKELFNENHVTNEYVENYNNSGINGRLFTSKTNGNTLFFPFGGNMNYNRCCLINCICEIWTKTINKKTNYSPIAFFIGDKKLKLENYFQRFDGLNIRGVIDKQNKV